MIWQLAFRNLWRGGLRTVLNISVLALAFIAIVFIQGFNQGILEQVSQAKIRFEIGDGQFWHPEYDPFDPIGLIDAHARPPLPLQQLIDNGDAIPQLIIPGSLYPEGRVLAIQIRGIDPEQTILDLPMDDLTQSEADIPLLIGGRMAASTNLAIGDVVTLRWRDGNGTFDAREGRIVTIMNTPVQDIDNGQVWMPLDRLRELALMANEATMVILKSDNNLSGIQSAWPLKSRSFLLKDITQLVRFRSIASGVLYIILLALALIAIFDTQILSIFRRRREIGTLVALGMTNQNVVRLFTLEGGLHGLLALLAGVVFGAPLLWFVSNHGIVLPQTTDQMGLALGNILYPVYSLWLVMGTAAVIFAGVLMVSYWPARQITQMAPTDALRGKAL